MLLEWGSKNTKRQGKSGTERPSRKEGKGEYKLTSMELLTGPKNVLNWTELYIRNSLLAYSKYVARAFLRLAYIFSFLVWFSLVYVLYFFSFSLSCSLLSSLYIQQSGVEEGKTRMMFFYLVLLFAAGPSPKTRFLSFSLTHLNGNNSGNNNSLK